MGTERKGNNWELLQTWEQSRKGTIGNLCKHGNRATREQLGTYANMGTEQQGNNWELLQTWEQSNKGTCPLASAREERETVETTNAVCENLEFCRESLAAAIAHFSFFCFCFLFSFFPPHGFHVDCVLFAAQSLCMCLCVCVFFCGEDGTLSLLF
jgi:hypothetical protein